MSFDSLKTRVSEYKEEKQELKESRIDLDFNIAKADALLEIGEKLDTGLMPSLEAVRRSFDEQEADLKDQADQLESSRKDLKNDVAAEERKHALAKEKLDKISGMHYGDKLSAAQRSGGKLLEELHSLMEELDLNETFDANSIQTVDGVKYRTDDYGDIHMQRDNNGVYQVLPNTRYRVNGYSYQTDGKGRVTHAEGVLRKRDGKRKPLNTTVKGMQDGDQRGHIIGDLFDGSNQNDNLIAQLGSVNQGSYKALETKLAGFLDRGDTITAGYEIHYEGKSDRPSMLVIDFEVNDRLTFPLSELSDSLNLSDKGRLERMDEKIRKCQEAGHTVQSSYRVEYSNNRDTCILFMTYRIDGGEELTVAFDSY